MNKPITDTQFDEAIKRALVIPEPDPAAFARMRSSVERAAGNSHSIGRRHPAGWAWVFAASLILVVQAAVLAIGPQKAAAAFQRLMSFVPGIGVVEQSGTLRILAEPVSQTREGITVKVSNALLTGSETQIRYGWLGVPRSAYPQEEANPGCLEQPWLRLADGTRIDLQSPVPPAVDEAALVLPCISGTLPGAVPEDWELVLRFIPAPPDYQVLPVVEEPTPLPTPIVSETSGQDTPAAVSPASRAEMTVTHSIAVDDGYILAGKISMPSEKEEFVQSGMLRLFDAQGREIFFSAPREPVDPGTRVDWIVQIQDGGVTFPLRITTSGQALERLDPAASARLTVDVGQNPQPGQEWLINQELQIGGYCFTLKRLSALADGYEITLDMGPDLASVSAEIENTQPVGGGGGGGLEGTYKLSMVYETPPVGELSLLFTRPVRKSGAVTVETTWAPAQPRDASPLAASSEACLTDQSLAGVPSLPPQMRGAMFLSQNQPVGVAAFSLEGVRLGVVPDVYKAGLAPDGKRLAVNTPSGLRLIETAGFSVSEVGGSFGNDLRWSPDGQWIASLWADGQPGLYVTSAGGGPARLLSDLGYEQIAGWSPDSQQVYFAIPGADQGGFVLRSASRGDGTITDVLTLDDSSLKFTAATVSPDGKWVAYRGFDNTSLYLKSLDGGSARLVLPKLGQATNGLVWSTNGRWLGLSIMTDANPQGEVFLLDPQTCEMYALGGASGPGGAIQGLIVQ